MFEVEEEVAFQSLTVKNMSEGVHISRLASLAAFTLGEADLKPRKASAAADTGLDAPIPLPNVSSKILAKVIEYCKYHVDAEKKADEKPAKTEEEIKTWDTEFVKVDQSTLFELILVRAVLAFSKDMSHQDSQTLVASVCV